MDFSSNSSGRKRPYQGDDDYSDQRRGNFQGAKKGNFGRKDFVSHKLSQKIRDASKSRCLNGVLTFKTVCRYGLSFLVIYLADT